MILGAARDTRKTNDERVFRDLASKDANNNSLQNLNGLHGYALAEGHWIGGSEAAFSPPRVALRRVPHPGWDGHV